MGWMRNVTPKARTSTTTSTTTHVEPTATRTRSPVEVVAALQLGIGNRAVGQMVASMSASAVAPSVDASPLVHTVPAIAPAGTAPFGGLTLTPADRGGPPDTMSWSELLAAIDEQQEWIDEQTSTTPELQARSARLAALRAAQSIVSDRASGVAATPSRAGKPATAGRHAGRRGHAGARHTTSHVTRPAPAPLPTRPRSLERSLDVRSMSPGAIRAELDLVVAYLAAHPPRHERDLLLMELPTLEQAAGVHQAEQQVERRQQKLAAALSPTTGAEADQLLEILHRVQDAERDPSQDGVWLIHYGNLVLPMQAAELVAVRKRVADGLLHGASAVNSILDDTYSAWRDRRDKNREHRIVHGLVKFTSGAEDIPEHVMTKMLEVGNLYVGRVRDRGRAGALVMAGTDLLVFDRFARYEAKKIGDWEGDLVGGAARWVLALTILKESLGLLAGVGAAGLAAKAGGGVFGALRAGATITAVTTGTGAVAGGVGAAATGGDVVHGVRAGAGAGFGVGANALTAGASRIATVGEAMKATSLVGKAIGVTKAVAIDAAANVGVNVTEAAIEGGNVGTAALSSLAASPVSTLGGAVVDRYARGLTAITAGRTVVGTAAGAASAAASGDDILAGALEGGLTAGGLALAHPNQPRGATDRVQEPPAKPPASATSGVPGAVAVPASATSGVPGAVPVPVAVPVAARVPAAAPSLADELDAHFLHLEDDVAKHNPDGTDMYRVRSDVSDVRFSHEHGSELDVRRVAGITVHDGHAPLAIPDPRAVPAPAVLGAARPAAQVPDTWLVDGARAGITDPTVAHDTNFKPNHEHGEFQTRNAQVVAGPSATGVTTPSGPMFGTDHVVGGAAGAMFDPASGTWSRPQTPFPRPLNPLGQLAPFTERSGDEWHAWEQTHGPLTPQQRYALWFYGDDLSGPLNASLRGGQAQQFVTDPLAAEAAASQIDSAMRPVPFDTVVHRKTSMSEFRSIGIRDPADLPNAVGRDVLQPAYTSTSIEPGHWSGPIDLIIMVPKGTRGRYLAGTDPASLATNPLNPGPATPLASMPSEMEFLVERGTTFSIEAAYIDPGTGRWQVELRIQAQGTSPLANPSPLPGAPTRP